MNLPKTHTLLVKSVMASFVVVILFAMSFVFVDKQYHTIMFRGMTIGLIVMILSANAAGYINNKIERP